ncbi:hypothetical protein ASG56_06315 [Rhodococcus sp. Leaf7]|uniref:nuclear transport factor 2 family protein n=1 Tax=unclassified Rhodococcus (in: high G+C Gram-positive bacteria) TaxID=192944 RepID=UPI0007015B90|nr:MULTISPECIES: nuclear transport factor 2 family protein [unclassified Rhodococcus (in: high G+C Gram-positive bacteria)]KQU07151.1 hypothetical protein ASG56_06315 [Rhodococcus sp. Leaf7]KQU42669.1 hypothetical protein ASG64_06315 [Rhodococcus sp. Leaf247]
MTTLATIRSEIDALVAEFAYRIDHEGGHTVHELFTADGTYDLSGWAITGHEQIKRFYDDRRNSGPRTSRHLFTGLRLDPTFTAETVTGNCVLTLHAHAGVAPLPLDPVMIADYADTYRRDGNGQWLFHHRRVTPIFLDAVNVDR